MRFPGWDVVLVHLACLPMPDWEENAALVNALQRHAAVATQKSFAEGFGLTVLAAATPAVRIGKHRGADPAHPAAHGDAVVIPLHRG